LVKNSETEISRWRAPISAAEVTSLGFGAAAGVSSTSVFGFGIGLDMVFANLLRPARPRRRRANFH
jgi:hypothetical protein